MIKREKISHVILKILEKINKEEGLGLEVSEETIIIGESSKLDSMAFLDLISAIEEWMDHTFGMFISISSDEENFEPDGPFGNAGRLADYLTEVITKEGLNP